METPKSKNTKATTLQKPEAVPPQDTDPSADPSTDPNADPDADPDANPDADPDAPSSLPSTPSSLPSTPLNPTHLARTAALHGELLAVIAENGIIPTQFVNSSNHILTLDVFNTRVRPSYMTTRASL